MRMMMRLFTLKRLALAGLLPAHLLAQTFSPVIDTPVAAASVVLDPLDNIYLLNAVDKSISRFTPDYKLLARATFQEGWDLLRLDAGDPFKLLLYYPGAFRIAVLDAQLSTIIQVDEPKLGDQSLVCHYDGNSYVLFDGATLQIQQIGNPRTQPMPYRLPDPMQRTPPGSRLKKDGEYIYLFRPGNGLRRFTNNLFENRSWVDPQIMHADVDGQFLYFVKYKTLYRQDLLTGAVAELYTAGSSIHSLSVGKQHLALLEGRLLHTWKLR
ncbi:MAG: hypothetical protein IT266_12035 [Saprospiraceae bacterium]|nr:hypothetical protein [Saprospiraceae bacterium]